MEHPFFPTATTRAEAMRWLNISEKLLSGRDLMGSKSFATRARDADPTLAPAEEILTIVDTLLVGDSRIRNNQQDWYSILRLTPQQGQDSELVAARYRNLALILNPQRSKYPLAEEAFRLVVDAWSVLSNPSRKAIYDKELSFYFHAHQQQQQPDPFHKHSTTMPQNFIFFGSGDSSTVAQPGIHAAGSNFFRDQQLPTQTQEQNLVDVPLGSSLFYGSGSKSSQEPAYKQAPPSYTDFSGNATRASRSIQEPVNDKRKQPMEDYSNATDKDNADAGETVEDDEVNEDEDEDEDEALPFWTACPYCYYMYQYSGVYSDCTLRCQNCRRAFQALKIPAPPPVMAGQEAYFCCWGFFPLGVSMENWGKHKSASSTWSPFSPMFSGPRNGNEKGAEVKNSGPRVYVDEDEVFVEISDSSGSDNDWQNDRQPKNKKVKSVKGQETNGMRPTSSAKKVQDDKHKNFNVGDAFALRDGVEMPNEIASEPSKKGRTVNARKQPNRVAKNFGKLDLNVEYNNETEKPAPKVAQGNGTGRGEDDNIEGIGFFEGLDEFLTSLPILNVVGDDKVVKAA
ncbi:hypothetical protein F511_13142 [Dorcoceras hygrometricum]|uniref:J domain-containing protein n=1 Tax=Dorcoceras hygrometricum TaxID=472368 RepID=A0A2Z7CX82_9LAMI|nr:hypothetical protein F511_13142 [Dorcoceras hygrometricum]